MGESKGFPHHVPSQKMNTHILVTHTRYLRDILTNPPSVSYISLQYT